MKLEEALGLAAQIYCNTENENKVLDTEIVEAVARLLVRETSIKKARNRIKEAFDNDPEFREGYVANASALIQGTTRRRLTVPEANALANRIVKLFFED